MSLGEPNVKRALSWILDRLASEPGAKRSDLVDQASREFDLTPLQADFLYRQLRAGTGPGQPPVSPKE